MTQSELRSQKLIARFGTDNILDILGPNVLNHTQSINSRLAEFGISHKTAARWIRTHIPTDLYAELAPYQKALADAQRQATCLDRYGVINPTLDPTIRSKVAETNLAKYGSISPTNNALVRQKQIAACLDKYGCENPLSNSDVQARRKETLMEKFGGPSPMYDDAVRHKVADTNELRYGGASPMHDKTVRDKVAATCDLRYGGPSCFSSPDIQARAKQAQIKKYGGHYNSIPPDEIYRRLAEQQLEPLEPITHNSDFHKTIKVRCLRKGCGKVFETQMNVHGSALSLRLHQVVFRCCDCRKRKSELEDFAREYVKSKYYPSAYQWSYIPWMDGKEIDIFIPDRNIGIEINGFHSHNSYMDPYTKGPGKDPGFHKFKSDCCLEHSIKLYHFWYDRDTDFDRQRVTDFIDAILTDPPTVDPGDKISRDIYPDPTEAGLPYKELPPEPFDSPRGICYNSGYWQF